MPNVWKLLFVVLILFFALNFETNANPPEETVLRDSQIADEDLTLSRARAWLETVQGWKPGRVQEREATDRSQRRGRRRLGTEDPNSELYSVSQQISSERSLLASGSTWWTSRNIFNPTIRTNSAAGAMAVVLQLSTSLRINLGIEKAFLALAFQGIRGDLPPAAAHLDFSSLRTAIETQLSLIAAEIVKDFGIENFRRLLLVFHESDWELLPKKGAGLRKIQCAGDVAGLLSPE